MDNNRRKWYSLDSRGLSNLLVVCAGILLYLTLTHIPQVKAALQGLMNILSPFVLGFAMAFLLNAPTNFFEKKVFHKLKCRRALSILTVYLIALLCIVILLLLVIPQILNSAASLAGSISTYVMELDRIVRQFISGLELSPEIAAEVTDIYEQLSASTTNFVDIAKSALNALPELFNFGVAIGNGVINGITALIASIYMLAGKARLTRQFKKLIFAFVSPNGAQRILKLGRQANIIFVGFFNGKLLDSFIIGVLCFLLTTIFRIPYAALISTVIGVTNIIPFFGPIIGAVPSLLILVIVDPWSALIFGVLILALQQFDGNILGPKILGNSTGLSPIWVLISIVVGSGLFGFAGMLLGVPTFAVICTVVRELADERLARMGIDANGVPLELLAEEEKETSSSEL